MIDSAPIIRRARKQTLRVPVREVLLLMLLLCALLGLADMARANGGFLQIRNGYFWDPITAEYFVPRGMAYQTWNPPVGADQTFPQFDYDMVEFKKMYCNSVRAEMVWNVVENPQGVFDWSKPDELVAKAEQLGMKLFVLVGFNYAPDWFPADWKAVNSQGSNSVVVNYEHPAARLAYSNYIYQVTSRYKDKTIIGAWILGNEYAYFDLFNANRQLLGYDSYSIASFRAYLAATYSNNITALNATWHTAHNSFSFIPVPTVYPPDRHDPGYHDLIQWRKKSIGDYVAGGCVAAGLADPNHLRTYSMVGGVFTGDDGFYTCEDARTIVARCAAAGAPLHFWSLNNYAGATIGDEMRSADYGIRKYQAQSGLPVMISETGHSSTENYPETAALRQAAANPSQMWEAFTSGAIGMHVFTWNDRDVYAAGDFSREQGFGIVNQTRLVKNPVYQNSVEVFRRMENIQFDKLFGGSSNAPRDMQFFWSIASDMGWNRANVENAFLWGALKRLGYQPGIIYDEEFDRGDFTNAPAMVLSRCYQLKPAHLERIATNVVTAGIHLYADADLPGQFNAYNFQNPTWASRMSSLFGLNVASAVPGIDSGITNVEFAFFSTASATSFGAFTPGFTESLYSWKVWHGLSASSGTTVVTHRGVNDSQSPMPALQIKNLGTAKTAINTFALGQLFSNGDATNTLNVHSYWLRTVMSNHFGLTPKVSLSGPGALFCITDYRVCQNGSILISLLNEDTNAATVTVTAPALIAGKTVEDLTFGGILATNANGAVIVPVPGDTLVVIYAYPRTAAADSSLVNTNANKVWIQSAPLAVWPNGPGYEVTISHDVIETNLNLIVSFERSQFPARIYSQSSPISVSGKTNRVVTVPIPDADLNDVDYVSSRDGGEFILRARLEKNGLRISESVLPVRLLWSVRPTSLPATVLPNNTYNVTLKWEELPSYEPSEGTTPLSRADLWQPVFAPLQNYDVVLELRTNGVAVVSSHFLTSDGTSNHQYSITVPAGVTGPFTWFAYLRPAPQSSVNVVDSFEDRTTGNGASFVQPWSAYNYSESGTAQLFAVGVDTQATAGVRSVFLVVTNPVDRGSFSGFGLTYTFPFDFALDSSQLTNYTFSCDFKEAALRSCILELQLNDAYGGQFHFTNIYTPGPNGWGTISASLNQFSVPSYVGFFARGKVRQIAVNVQMLGTGVTYNASIDNIKFTGPSAPPPATLTRDVMESFEDRLSGVNPDSGSPLTAPWTPYVYSQANNAASLAGGINQEASEGGQGAFQVVQNPPNPGSFSGFGLFYSITNPFALPASRAQWTNYSFGFDFREASSHACILEIQVKSSPNDWIGFTNAYQPGMNQWASIKATLNQFKTNGAFNGAHIEALVVNVQMLDKNTTYLGSFDNIRFDAPELPNPPELRYGIYDSSNDSLPDSDGDGIPDVYETGTGIYVSPTNTGTNPNKFDTDGDGLSDRFEIIAGTNPNLAGDVFRIQETRRNTNGTVTFSWLARTNKIYGVTYLDGSVAVGAQFLPLEGLNSFSVATNGLFQATDPTPAAGNAQRSYRITVRNP